MTLQPNVEAARACYRTVFVSDLHLGTRDAKAAALASFLKSVDCEFLYLVGDIVDGWRLKRRWYWDRYHDRFLRRVVKKAKSSTKVIFIPGNHDEGLRAQALRGAEIAGVVIVHRAFHVTADGRKLLVLHGDEFDGVIRYAKVLAYMGDIAYDMALRGNGWFNAVRRWMGFPYWSVSKWLKKQVKEAVKFIDNLESAALREARACGADGVVCGHIHTAKLELHDGQVYANTGDWVESCTALVEHLDGRLELLDLSHLVSTKDADEQESTYSDVPTFGLQAT